MRSFRVDLGLGAGAQPTDAFGPATVNLANGNLTMRVDSPTLATVAGPLGVSYSYNSQAQANAGLTGAYYNDPGQTRVFPATDPDLERRDTDINFEWGVEVGPGAGIDGANFLVRWTGFIATPTSGTYWIGAGNDDGVRIYVDGVKVLERWYDQFNGDGTYGSGVEFTAGVGKPIVVEYSPAPCPAPASPGPSAPTPARRPTRPAWPPPASPACARW